MRPEERPQIPEFWPELLSAGPPRSPELYGQGCGHPERRSLRVTGMVQFILFPWQQPQPSGRKDGKPERVGWTLEKDGHWEAQVLCQCGRISWCPGGLARADAAELLQKRGQPVPEGLWPAEGLARTTFNLPPEGAPEEA